MEKTDGKSKLDGTCFKILTIMTLFKPSTHFNELFRELKERNMEMSKPTLSAHLKHLVEQEYVIKKEEENSQFVTYSLNTEKTEQLKEVANRTKKIAKAFKENEREFYSLSEEDQVSVVIATELSRKVEEIRALIDYRLHPNDLGRIVYANFLDSPLLYIGQKWIIKKSLEDEHYRKKILKLLDDWEESFK